MQKWVAVPGFLIFWLLVRSLACAAPLTVVAIPLEFNPYHPEQTHYGRLTFLSGFELRSATPSFGGLSSLALSPDGKTLYTVSDRGYGLSALLHHDPAGRLSNVTSWEMTALVDLKGRRLLSGAGDAEALVREPDGAFLVAFEGRHRLWRYPSLTGIFTGRPTAVPLPPEIAKAPENGGIEAMARLHDGRLLLLTETFTNRDGSLKGWLLAPGFTAPVSYAQSDGFAPTDLAILANGDALLLERYYTVLGGPAARLRYLPQQNIQPGARLQGERLVEWRRPLAVDNFEGLAVHDETPTSTLIYLISDDNYSPLQRTLLLQFRLQATGTP